ncbi:MAG: carboxypeptidase regulatory-like domain-containing protein [Pyrinomonadaceae bacterium]
MMLFRSLSRSFACIFCMFALAFCALAQDLDNVTVTGRVTDTNGLAVVGATVTAISVDTGVERTVVTDDDGRYKIVQLKPGTYKIKVSQSGFGTQETPAIATIAAQNVQQDFKLSPADVRAETTVTVTGDDGPAVDTTRTIVGGTITEREIEEIPNSTRNPLDLVLTLGGTSEEALSTRDLAEDRNADNRPPPTEQGNFSLSGGASYSNNLTIDGLDNNDDRAANSRFTPSLESIAEVQVITNQFSAEYGRASGGRINLRTRAGGNQFRGRAFLFVKHDNWNANTYYNNLTTFRIDDSFTYNGGSGTGTNVTNQNRLAQNIAREPLGRVDFVQFTPGFTLSGPVILPFGEGRSIYNGRNRTFFSIAYEYDNLDDTTLIDAFVPVGTNSRFSLPAPTSTTTFCENLNAGTTCGTNAAFISRYQQFVKTPNKNHTFTARIDHRLSKNNDLTVGLQLGRKRNQRQNVASTTRLEEALQGTSADTDGLNFTDNHVFGANTVNQFRMQWSRYLPSYEAANPAAPVVLISYTDPLVATSNSGRTLIAGNSTASNSARGLFVDKRREQRWQFQDSLTHIIKSNTFKLGFDFQRVNSFNLDQGDATGTYNFGNGTHCVGGAPTCTGTGSTLQAVQNYLLNQPTRYRHNFGTSSTVKNTYWSVFLNDESRVTRNLTVNVGLRYEKEKVLADNNNFGPRFGIAWDPFKKGTGVIRFGGGIFYNRVLLRTIDDFIIGGQLEAFDTNNIGTTTNTNVTRKAVLLAIASNFPNGFTSSQQLRNFVNPILIANGGTAGQGFTSGNDGFTRFVDAKTLKIPESYQFNLGFEREIAKGFVFEANYTWNKAVHLWGEFNPNSPSLAIANRLLGTSFTDWTSYLNGRSFPLGTTTYNFYLGNPSDNIGNTTTQNGTTVCTSSTTVCHINLNTINPSEGSTAPLGIALQAINQFRPVRHDGNPNNDTLTQQQLLVSDRKSFYQGLILELRSRFKQYGMGFSGNFRIAYTLSKARDDGLNNTSDAEINGDFGREWSRALQDRRHRIAISGSFNMPNWLGKVRLSPLFRFGSSAPFNLSYSGIDRNLDDLANDRMNFSGDVKDIKWRKPGSPVPTALLSQFSLQPIGAKGGNLPRNAGTGPIFWTFDMSVTREWKMGERFRLRPTVEFDNLLNAKVFSFGSGFIDYSTFGVQSNPTLTCNPSTSTACLPPVGTTIFRQNNKATFETHEFLIPTRALRPRQIRFGMRLDF